MKAKTKKKKRCLFSSFYFQVWLRMKYSLFQVSYHIAFLFFPQIFVFLSLNCQHHHMNIKFLEKYKINSYANRSEVI